MIYKDILMSNRKETNSGKGPGKAYRKGVSLIELFERFPDNEAAEKWLEGWRWGDEPTCPRCGSTEVSIRKSRKPMPFHCRNCRKYFSVRTDTAMACSQIPLQKWVIGLFLYVSNLKAISSMRLHRDLKIKQSSAWYMLQRFREAFGEEKGLLSGVVEVDETYVGGKEGLKSKSKKLNAGRGGVGKSIVIGAKERGSNKVRAKVIPNVKRDTLHQFINENIEPGAVVNTDDLMSYKKLQRHEHEFVKHSVGEYVSHQAHINGIESFWSLLKRAHKGTYHKISKKHLNRYVNEFVVRHNVREEDTLVQMGLVFRGLIGRRIKYKDLVSGMDGRAN